MKKLRISTGTLLLLYIGVFFFLPFSLLFIMQQGQNSVEFDWEKNLDTFFLMSWTIMFITSIVFGILLVLGRIDKYFPKALMLVGAMMFLLCVRIGINFLFD